MAAITAKISIVARALVPVHVALTGYLYSTVKGRETGPNAILARGTLKSRISAHATNNVTDKISLSGTLSAQVTGSIPAITIDPISLSGTLSGNIPGRLYLNAFVAMYGFLDGRIKSSNNSICFDLTANIDIQEILGVGCNLKGTMMSLTRYRGDTYPVLSRLSKNGNSNIAGYTFKMSTQINGEQIYTSIGTIRDSINGIVEFELENNAIKTAGSGVYDIEGNNGSYIYTFDKGIFTLLEDVTA